MHTAICTFQDHEAAERAREQLLRAGFQRHDVHIEHQARAGGQGHSGEDPRGWEGTDHEVAVDRGTIDRVAGFFVRLFGDSSSHGHDRTYGDAVDSGRCVLVVDTQDEAEAQRAREVLAGHSAADLNVVHRPEHRPLRDIVGSSPAHVESPARVQAAFHGRSTDWSDRTEAANERALASQSGEQRPLDLREVDLDLDRGGRRHDDPDKPAR